MNAAEHADTIRRALRKPPYSDSEWAANGAALEALAALVDDLEAARAELIEANDQGADLIAEREVAIERARTLRELLAYSVRLERRVSIGNIDSHVALSPIRREVWDEIVAALAAGELPPEPEPRECSSLGSTEKVHRYPLDELGTKCYCRETVLASAGNDLPSRPTWIATHLSRSSWSPWLGVFCSPQPWRRA